MDFSFMYTLLDHAICLLIFFVVDYFVLVLMCERLRRGIFKNSNNRCKNSPRNGPRKAGRRQKKCKRGRKGQMTWQDVTKVILSLIQEDTPQEDGADHISDRTTGGATQPPTDVKNDCSSSGVGPSNENGLQEDQAKLPQRNIITEGVITGQDGLGAIKISLAQEESSPCQLDESQPQGAGCMADSGAEPAGKISVVQKSLPHELTKTSSHHTIIPKDKEKTKQLKKKGWMSKKKDLKSPWAEWKKKVPELKTLVQKLETNKKIFRYPYQLGMSITVGKSPEDGNTSANRKSAAPDNKDENLNNLPKEQSDKNGSTSEQSSEVSSSDIKTPEESDGDKTTSESETTKSAEEIPPDVLRISLVETIYESKAVITGKPTKAGKMKTLGHKRKNFHLRSGPPTNPPASSEVLLPNENVLKSCELPKTSVSEGQLKETGPSSPETATNKTRVEDVSGKHGKDVVCADSPKCDETTSKNNMPAQSSPSSDVPGSLEPNADLLERRRLAKIGRKQRARIRKKIAQEAAQTAIKLRERLITTDDGEIIINRDQEDWAEEIGLPFSIAVSFVLKQLLL
ncbi:hypothetical protein HOLleu_40269 [Holothuria leucospilota]|uniref:Uncharacterized protein n=1 Tax=Holothuria leucospilota TaxID=206669 RepID=A0A9Q1BBJ5_HOLLE|nr:hypothetical protein HOLleu_40269 [Holothuria leucospilota]